MKKERLSTKPKRKDSGRSRNITDSDIMVIVQILEGWGDSKLTWDALTAEVEERLFCRYTRQTLGRYQLICDAFATAKKAKAFQGAKTQQRGGSVTKRTTDERVSLLESKLKHKEKAFNSLACQMATVIHNAVLAGFTKEMLFRPMPKPDRDWTEL